MHFPVSGVDCAWWVPPVVALGVSSLTASAGVSGAFLLLPFQVSVLGFTGPAVSPTNLVFNVIGTPGGVYRYWKEGRMAWRLARALILGTLPGVFLGAVVRIRLLPDARSFKVFAGCVLLYLGLRLFLQPAAHGQPAVAKKDPTRALLVLGLAVGLIGGVYGIGGGALIAPFLVAVLGLPVHAVAGACLMATLATSVAGVASFELLGRTVFAASAPQPDWALGALFGAGGLAGTYLGARMQKFIPERWIRLGLAVFVSGLGLRYFVEFAGG